MPKASMSGILATAIVGAKNNSAYLADFAETICLYHKRVDEWQTAFRGGDVVLSILSTLWVLWLLQRPVTYSEA